jgi:hypothetical protein
MEIKRMHDKADKRSMVYIAGYGRSGSTLLERILDSHPKMIGMGELSYLPEYLMNKDLRCACGSELRECSFWKPICNEFLESFEESLEEVLSIQRDIEAFGPWRKTGFRTKLNEKYRRYRELSQSLYEVIWRNSPPDIEYLIDSSKTAYTSARKPKILHTFRDIDIHVIHLVRDVRAVMWSVIGRGLNRNLDNNRIKTVFLPGVRALIGWLAANYFAHSLKRVLPNNRYLIIRYEDLVTHTDEVLAEISKFLSIDLYLAAKNLQNGKMISRSHQLAGNRMKKLKSIHLRPDFEWKKSLLNRHKILASVFASNELKRYGYNK